MSQFPSSGSKNPAFADALERAKQVRDPVLIPFGLFCPVFPLILINFHLTASLKLHYSIKMTSLLLNDVLITGNYVILLTYSTVMTEIMLPTRLTTI